MILVYPVEKSALARITHASVADRLALSHPSLDVCDNRYCDCHVAVGGAKFFNSPHSMCVITDIATGVTGMVQCLERGLPVSRLRVMGDHRVMG